MGLETRYLDVFRFFYLKLDCWHSPVKAPKLSLVSLSSQVTETCPRRRSACCWDAYDDVEKTGFHIDVSDEDVSH